MMEKLHSIQFGMAMLFGIARTHDVIDKLDVEIKKAKENEISVCSKGQ